MATRSGDELTELESRQEPRLVKALEMVAPGTALREGIDNVLHARTGGLLVIGEPEELSFLFSGGIKLALAQYRELAAFSQFASDLDDATRRQLEHGQRVTELMKQKQYGPMSVAEMGIVLFAANEGHLSGVDVSKVLDFEAALLLYMRAEHGNFMKEIDKTGAYNDDIVATMRAALEKFKATQTF